MNDVTVEEWRLAQFERMGFSQPASLLLNEWEADVHETYELVVTQGCPQHLAMRILRPLTDRPAYNAGAVERISEYSNA